MFKGCTVNLASQTRHWLIIIIYTANLPTSAKQSINTDPCSVYHLQTCTYFLLKAAGSLYCVGINEQMNERANKSVLHIWGCSLIADRDPRDLIKGHFTEVRFLLHLQQVTNWNKGALKALHLKTPEPQRNVEAVFFVPFVLWSDGSKMSVCFV